MADVNVSESTKSNNKKNFKRKVGNEHVLKKRTPHKPERHENAVYVTNKTNFKALLSKCEKIIDKNEKEIIIYCMGAAIQRGINLSLQLCEKHSSFQISVSTSTVDLVDDLEPATDEVDYEIQKRQNSALRICIVRPDLLEALKPTQ